MYVVYTDIVLHLRHNNTTSLSRGAFHVGAPAWHHAAQIKKPTTE